MQPNSPNTRTRSVLFRSIPWLVLCLGLITTLITSIYAQKHAEATLEEEFYFRVNQVTEKIKSRLEAYELVLRGATALFNASQEVSRHEFQNYVNVLQLQSNYPGIQGIGFSQWLTAREKTRHLARVQAEGFPGYTLRPEGERDVYSAVLYIEPFDWRNQRAFGYDMYSEPVRRAAMSQARDENRAAITGKVTLLQETDAEKQPGFLMYLPVYRNALPHDSLAQRRANLTGWVYAPFRMNDLMSGILDRYFGDLSETLDLEIYDGRTATPESLMYDIDTGPGLPAIQRQSRFAHTEILEAGGHQWTIVIHSLPGFESRLKSERAQFITVAGIGVSLLIAWIAWLLATGRARAMQLAEKKNLELNVTNKQLMESERYQNALLSNLPAAVVVHGPDSAIRYCNAQALRILGLNEAEARGRKALNSEWRFLHEDGKPLPADEYPVNLVLSEKKPLHGYIAGIDRGQELGICWVAINAYPDLNSEGQVTQVVISFLDITDLKQTETALLKSYKEIQDLYHNAPCGYHSIGKDGVFLQINDTELSWLGYTRAEIVGRKRFIDVLSPSSIELFHDNFPGFMQRGWVKDLEYEFIRKDGTVLPVLLSATAIRDSYGNYLMSRSTIFDITERKRAERALQDEQRHTRQLLDNLPAGVVVHAADGAISYTNSAARAFFRVTGEAATGRMVPDFNWHVLRENGSTMPASDYPERKVLESKHPLNNYVVGVGKGKQEEIRWALVNAFPDFGIDGAIHEVVVSFVDITERKLAENALKNINRFYSVLTRANEAIIRATGQDQLFEDICRIAVEDGQFVMAWVGLMDNDLREINPVCHWGNEAGYLEYLRQVGILSFNGPTAQALHSGEYRLSQDIAADAAMNPWRQEAVQRGYRSSAAFPLRRGDKIVGAINLYAAQAHYFNSDIIQLLDDLAMDISFALGAFDQQDRRAFAETQLQQLNQELEQRVAERTRQLENANRELESFSYSVSHDLRAPLRSIDGFSEILQKSYAERLDDKGQDYLGRVRRASKRMGELIDDLLQLSRVSRAELKKEQVDLSAMVQSIVREIQDTAPQRNVTWIIQEHVAVQADSRLMKVVLENLLGNAWKFTSKQPMPRIEFGLIAQNDEKVIFVRDNGAGFDMQYAGKLFGAFQRLHKIEEFEGTGIGLATVQRIIHRHGGRVWAEGQSGNGASIYFIL